MIYFSATIFTSAFLLFMVQPIIAKQILPWFGGSSAVWTTCMVFFQMILLLGYWYADFVVRKLSKRKQAIFHSVVVVISLIWLPIIASDVWKPAADTEPSTRILLLLLVTVGLPYLLPQGLWFKLGLHGATRKPRCIGCLRFLTLLRFFLYWPTHL